MPMFVQWDGEPEEHEESTADAGDPRTVVCPTCQTPAGSPCKRPSGREAAEYHKARRVAAESATAPDDSEEITADAESPVDGELEEARFGVDE